MMRGCPFRTLGNEVTANDELVRQDLNLIFEVVKNKLVAFFAREKAKGNFGKPADPERMADFTSGTQRFGARRELSVAGLTLRKNAPPP